MNLNHNNIISVFSSLNAVSEFIWGVPVLVLTLFAGVYLSLRLRLPQLHILGLFRDVLSSMKRPSSQSGGISQRQGFSTALAATVGTGSVTGVACALYTGGRGCIFWMWVSAFFGMCLSYSENFLSLKKLSPNGSGAFCYLCSVAKPLGVSYALFSVLASLGMGNMTQTSSAVSAASQGFALPKWLCAVSVVVFCAFAIRDKSKCASLCERLVPLAALTFVLTSLLILALHPYKTFVSLTGIIGDAFNIRACAGGTLSAFFIRTCVGGLRRGVFSHEAGLGSTCAIHSSCHIKDPRLQGKLAMAEVFIDTMVICTLTALVILVSETDYASQPDGTLTVVNAYTACLGAKALGRVFTCLCLTLFSLCTLCGWFFIGESSFCCLFPKGDLAYKLVYLLCAYLGSQFAIQTVWDLSDIFNALMAIPNLIGVLLLSGKILPPKFRPQRDG